MRLLEVTLQEAIPRPGKSLAWGMRNTALFSEKGDGDGPYNIDYDPVTGLVTIERGGQSRSVHVTRTRDMVLAPVDAPLPASKPDAQKNPGLAAMAAVNAAKQNMAKKVQTGP